MKSPITSKEMKIQKRKETFRYKGKEVPIMYHYYLCEDSGKEFTDTELDEINLNQIYTQKLENYT